VTSLRARLLIGLLGGMLIVQLAIYVLIYWRIEDEIDQLFDAELERSALSIVPGPGMLLPIAPPPHKVDNPLAGMIITVWGDSDSAPDFQSESIQGMPKSSPLGFSKTVIDGKRWRLFTTVSGKKLIIAAQPRRVHIDAARQITVRTLLPSLSVLPIAALAIWLAVSFGLRPLARVTSELRLRSHRDLSPLDASHQPPDIAPVISALNDLMRRLSETISKQRKFIADAAHELLTPLTAVGLQSQLIARAEGEARRREALSDLQGGVSRALHLARQLLTLARNDVDDGAQIIASVNLAKIIRQVVAIHLPIAAIKGVRLDVQVINEAIMSGEEDALRILVANLVDNAIKYSDRGGAIRLTLQSRGEGIWLDVEDTGPGIPLLERERVFDRFYRVGANAESGSGLGLAIARDIAKRHQAQISLSTSKALGGLCAGVRFRPTENSGKAAVLLRNTA
jgi:two-component system, OmpR family, sensor kinase